MLRAAMRAELGHAHLEVAQDLEQEGLELGVGLVDLVDQQHDRVLASVIARSSGRGRMKRSEKKTSSCAEMRSTASRSVPAPAEHLADLVLEDLRVEELLGVLPLVERLGLVEALVALQADQVVAERTRRRTLASSVLPTPAGPSTRIGLRSCAAR